eukprot:g2508.t1
MLRHCMHGLFAIGACLANELDVYRVLHGGAFGRRQGLHERLRDNSARAADPAAIPVPRLDAQSTIDLLRRQNDDPAVRVIEDAARLSDGAHCEQTRPGRGAAVSAKWAQSPQPLLRSVLELVHYGYIGGTLTWHQLERVGQLVLARNCSGLLTEFGGTRVTGTVQRHGRACAQQRSAPGMHMRVHYTGTFEDGRQFDSSRGRKPFEFTLGGGVIKGWNIGLQNMCVGERRVLRVPAYLAYGKDVMIFDVELLHLARA